MKKIHALITMAFIAAFATAFEVNAKEYKFMASKSCDGRGHTSEPRIGSGVSDERSNPLFNSGWNGGAGSNAGSYGENPPSAPTAPSTGTATRTGTSHGAGDYASPS